MHQQATHPKYHKLGCISDGHTDPELVEQQACACYSNVMFCIDQVVADRVLLARLVLLREELRMRAEEQDTQSFFGSDAEISNPNPGGRPEAAMDGVAPGTSHVMETEAATSQEQPQQQQPWSSMFYGFHRSNLPVRCAAFMKELLSVPERDRRLGLLSKVRV